MAEDQQRRGMSCPEARERIHRVLDGELMAAEARQELDAHLAGCAGCRQADAEFRAIQTALRSMPELPLPDPVLAEVRERTARGRPSRSRLLDWRVAAAAAVLAMAIYGSWSIIGPVVEPGPTEQEIAKATEEARMVLGMTGRALREAKQTAFNEVLAEEVTPALRHIPIRLRGETRPGRRSPGDDA